MTRNIKNYRTESFLEQIQGSWKFNDIRCLVFTVFSYLVIIHLVSQSTITFSKLTIVTLEQDVKYVQS